MLRVTPEKVLYINRIGQNLLNIQPGSEVPHTLHNSVQEAINEDSVKEIEMELNRRKYNFVITPIRDTGYVNIYGRDITERREKEDEIRLHSEIMTNLAEGVYLVRLEDGIIVFANPRFEEMFGYDPGEMIGKNVAIVNAPTDKTPEKTKQEIMGILKETREWHGEIYNIKKDGTPFWCYANVSLFDHYEYGTVIVSVHTDITERKKANKTLKESEAQFRSLFESRMIGTLFWNADGDITDANDMFLEMLGYTKDELLSGDVRWRDMTPPEYEEQDTKALDELATIGVMTPIEKEYICKDGSRLPILLGAASLPGSTLSGVAFILDITERKKAEKRITDLAKFPEENPNPILRITTEKVLYTNTAGQNLFNIRLGSDLPNIIEKTSQDAINQKISKELEVEINERIYSLVITPIKGEDYANIYGKDVTDKRRAEEAYRKIQKERQEKLTLLGQLAGGIGHELRNPLGAMKNASYFLNLAIDKPEPEVKETLDVLETEIKNCEMIINSLLGFASPRPPLFQKVNINEIVQNILSHIIIPENIEVIEKYNDKIPIILGDPHQLNHSFRNIIINAIQAMTEGGRLIIETKIPTSSIISISIKDTGIGIKKEHMKELFEPLFTTKAKGIGLGLSISRLMINNHKGKIDVQSELKKGTTFTIKLPIIMKGAESIG